MKTKVRYDGVDYAVEDSAENREQLKQIGQYLADGQSEVLILELETGGSLILAIGPGIPIAVTYLD